MAGEWANQRSSTSKPRHLWSPTASTDERKGGRPCHRVLVEIGPRPADAEEDEMEDEVEFVGDLDQIVESTMCSCNAGDDNPY